MSDLVRRILDGDPRAVARAATSIENRRPEAERLLSELFSHTGRAIIIGITGAPGSGKSTLVNQLARALRAESRTVGIIAVDPTSPYTGGAILGDRIRMQDHHRDPGVFIRSMATRGAFGGVARATLDLALLLDASGRDVVIIETVGVGQDEVDVARLADVTAVVLVPGMGDDVQAIKAGIMEIADVFLINKADQPGADRLEREIKAAAGLSPRRDAWNPPIVHTVATEGKGITEALDAIRSFPRSADRTRENWTFRLQSMYRERIAERAPAARIEDAAAEVADRRRDPWTVVRELSEPVAAHEIDHLGIAVRSIDEALQFYRGQLGLTVAARETVPHEKVCVAMLPIGGPRIELLEATGADSVIAKFIEKRGEGLHHVAVRVPDLAAAVERLKAAGARLVNEPRAGAGGHLYVFVHPASTGGVLLELIQSKAQEEI